MDPNDHENRPAYCDHTPLRVTLIYTNAGYRAASVVAALLGLTLLLVWDAKARQPEGEG